MFIHCLVFCALSLKPIIIVPGHFGSRLHMSTTRQPYWFCPRKIEKTYSWIRVRDLIPPFITCLVDQLTLEYDEQNDSIKSRDNTTISPEKIGEISGIRGVGPDFLNRYLPVNYERYILEFLEAGYHEGKDLFAATYDWRYGLEQPKAFFDGLRKLIEDAYEKNGHEKVLLLAHGLGAELSHMFLMEMNDKEWRKKYIDSATYVSPSFTGSGQAFYALWRLRFPYVHFRFEALRRFVASLGAFHAQLPNAVAYENTTLVIDPDGKEHKGKDLINFLIKNGKLTKEEIKLAEKNFKYTKQLPKEPDFNINILYNSGVRTPIGLKLMSWDDVGKPIYGHGDGLMGSKVIEWACQNWKGNDITVRCHDVILDNKEFHHRFLLKSPEIAKLIRHWMIDSPIDKSKSFSDDL